MEFVYHNLICSSDYLMLLHVCMVYLPREDKIYKDPLHALPVCNDRAIPDGNVYIIQDRKYASYGKSVVVIYLGFGAGLSVFMFTGFMKSIPLEIEEAAMIDGCTPIQTFFKIVLPIAKPTCVTVTILQAMWIWNDYLLPSLVLDQRKYKTVPMAVQYLKGGYGSVDMGAMMGTLVLAIVPIIIFYLFCQRYIIEGVVAGAVKG